MDGEKESIKAKFQASFVPLTVPLHEGEGWRVREKVKEGGGGIRLTQWCMRCGCHVSVSSFSALHAP